MAVSRLLPLYQKLSEVRCVVRAKTFSDLQQEDLGRRHTHLTIPCHTIRPHFFCFPINELYDIGTEILCKTCFGHNSTQIEALVTYSTSIESSRRYL